MNEKQKYEEHYLEKKRKAREKLKYFTEKTINTQKAFYKLSEELDKYGTKNEKF